MQVWYHPESPYAQRVLYLLDVLAIDAERISVNLAKREHRANNYVSINRFSRVPALVDNGLHLAESLAILRYLIGREVGRVNLVQSTDESSGPHAGKSAAAIESWYPSALRERAGVDQWLEYVAHHASRPFLDLAWSRTLAARYGFTVDSWIEAAALKKIGRELPVLEERFAGSSYLCGDQPTLADVALYPFVALADSAQLDLAVDAPKLNRWSEVMGNARMTHVFP